MHSQIKLLLNQPLLKGVAKGIGFNHNELVILAISYEFTCYRGL